MANTVASTPADSRTDWTRLGLIRTEAFRPIPEGPRSVPEVIDYALANWPDKVALIGRHAQYTYREMAEEIAAATSAMQALGVRTGDRVAATTANHAEVVIAYFAAQALGAIWIGINRSLAAPEKRFILEDCGANFYFAEQAAVEQIAPLRETLPELRAVIDMEPGDENSSWAKLLGQHRGDPPRTDPVDPYAPAAIAYTSGTTGRPKGVVHSQHNIVLVGAMGRLAGRGRAVGVERGGVALPITILNLMILGPVAAFQNGRTCILMDRIDTLGLAEWIKNAQIETFAAVPTMIYDLMTNPAVKPEDLVSLKAPGVGAAAMPDSFRDLYRQRFGRELGTGYGLTEAPTGVTGTDPEAPFVPGSCGQPLKHLRLSIQDAEGNALPAGESGEICVSGATTGEFAGLYTPMLGYWRRPEATAEALRDGWLHTGDIGRLDGQGNLFVEGRRNDVILRGGSNVYPAEVERVLHMDERVASCAVVGKPDIRLGELVVAFVQPAPGTEPNETFLDELKSICTDNLARYKIPEEWILVSEMPRNAMNKIVKGALKDQYFNA